MLVSPWNSRAGYWEGWAGGGAGLAPPSGPAVVTRHPAQWGSLGPASFPWDGAFSPWVLFMCFEDHFCIVRSEEKIF